MDKGQREGSCPGGQAEQGREVREMEEKSIKDMTAKEILRRQLELLAEASTQSEPNELIGLTHAMIALTELVN